MKKILILIIILIAQSFFSCKKTELTPQEQLSNTFWTGFFNYEPVKNGNTGGELIQPFAIEFLPNGSINWYEASGKYGGKWTLNDQIITITQDNKNIVTLSFIDGKISFMKIVGPPSKWSASNFQKYEPKSDKPQSNTNWIHEGSSYPIDLIDVDNHPGMIWGGTKTVSIEIKNNMIIESNGGFGSDRSIFAIIRNDKMNLIYKINSLGLVPFNYTKK